MNLTYRISTAILGFGSILCAFFLKFFTFTITAVIIKKTYSYSIFEAIKQMAEKGASAGGDKSEIMQILDPMIKPAVTFFVLVAIACLFALAISVLSASSNLHVPQAVLSGVGFILLVIAAGCGSSALGCLTGDEPKVALSSIATAASGELTKDNALSTLGTALSKVQVAQLSYGFYIVMAIFAVIFIMSLIFAFLYNDDQPKKTGKKHKKEYKRKKPMRKLSAIGK
ncbi:MAG: hypothetical protein ACI4GA_00085 [Acutalibacteraceae bacterium]